MGLISWQCALFCVIKSWGLDAISADSELISNEKHPLVKNLVKGKLGIENSVAEDHGTVQAVVLDLDGVAAVALNDID